MRVPYQGQDPEKATVVFVGLDANYSAQISDHPTFFQRILEYHEDGVGFWHRHGVHHPFLLPECPLPQNSSGVLYHRMFASMGLTPVFAEHISFVQLLDVPTVGRIEPTAFWNLFNPEHARKLDHLLVSEGWRAVFTSDDVFRSMFEARRQFGLFTWLPERPDWGMDFCVGKARFFKVRSFLAAISSYHLCKIGSLVRSMCIERNSESPELWTSTTLH